MSDELAAWLQVREPADWAARSAAQATAAGAAALSRAGTGPVAVLDLGTGAGSNLRYLAPRLGAARQRWTVVDRSDVVLRHLVDRTLAWAVARGMTGGRTAHGCELAGPHGEHWQVVTTVADLDALDRVPVAGQHLVTASALLDLVSDRWLATLATRCAEARAAACFALTYDGRLSCTPADADDEPVRGHFNRHQRTDKGLGGPAAGPEATACAVHRFAAAGFHVETVQTDWVIAPDATALQRELIDGWAYAATEMAPDLGAAIAAWKARRLDHLSAGTSHLRVGHHDLLALPR